ncbi:MAG: TonB-dependent receptor [Opitutae bacterium]|nr:TonB-dependent receptor [Opitutae bacterium]
MSPQAPHPRLASRPRTARRAIPFLALCAASAVCAQTTPPAKPGEEVVQLSVFEVSATTSPSYHTAQTLSGSRTVEEVRDLPLSIQVINPQQLADFNVTDFRNLGPLLVGAESTEQTNSDRAVNLRGFQSDTQLTNFFIRYLPSDTYNADRIEVIRGANSLIYGEADPGGLLNVVTVRARFDNRSAALSYRAGSDDLNRATIDVNAGNKRFALRALGLYHSKGSWEHWTGDLRRNVFLTGGLRLFDSRVTVRGDIEYGEQRVRGPSTVPTFNFTTADQAKAIPASLLAYLTDSLYARVPANGTLKSLLGYPVPESIVPIGTKFEGPDDIGRRRYRNVFGEIQFVPTQNWQLLLTANYQQMNFLNDVARNTGTVRYAASTGVFTVNRSWGRRTIDEGARGVRLFSSYELDLGWTHQRLITAADYNRHDVDSINDELYTLATNAAVTEVFTLTPGALDNDRLAVVAYPSGLAGTGYRPLTNNGNNLNRVDAYAGLVAASGSYLNGRLRTLLGARYDKFDNEQRDPIFAGNTRTFGSARTTSDSRVSPTLGALAHVTKHFSLFTTYSESLKNTNGFRFDENNQVLPPQTGKGTEGGVKLDLWDARVNAQLSAFDIEKTNIAENKTITTNDPVTGLPVSRVVSVPGQTGRSKGYEAQVDVDPTPQWTVSGGFAYTDAKITASATDPSSVGRRFQGGKKYAFNLLTRYAFADGPLKGFNVGGALKYRSQPFFANVNGVNVYLDESTVADVFVGYRVKVGKRVTWRSQLSIGNVLDVQDRYTNGGSVRYTEPRSVQWTNTLSF